MFNVYNILNKHKYNIIITVITVFFALSQTDSSRTLPRLLTCQSHVHAQQRWANHIQQCDVQQRQWKTQINFSQNRVQFDQRVSNVFMDYVWLCFHYRWCQACVCSSCEQDAVSGRETPELHTQTEHHQQR